MVFGIPESVECTLDLCPCDSCVDSFDEHECGRGDEGERGCLCLGSSEGVCDINGGKGGAVTGANWMVLGEASKTCFAN